MSTDFDPTNVDLTDLKPGSPLLQQITCYWQLGENEYDGRIGEGFLPCCGSVVVRSSANGHASGVRISALFVILIVSTSLTFFPVVAARVRWCRIPLYVYLFARYFGAGVIVATAFIQ